MAKLKTKTAKLLTGLVAVFLVVAGGAYMAYAIRHEHRELGQYKITDTYIGEDLSHSLDLKLAAKAAYPSSPVTVEKQLGTAGGYPEKIFKFSVKTDSLTEYGLLITPKSPPPAGGYPALILLHGYVTPSRYVTQKDYIGDMEFYASQGFAVFKPDYRGQGYSRHQGQPDSAYYSMSYNTDVMSLISALKQTGFVDKSNISLWGHSLGSYIALRAAVLSPDVKNLILLSGPVDSLKKMYLTYLPSSDANDPYALATRRMVFARYGSPAQNQRFWYDASPINYVSRLTARVQIYAGLKDQIVPPEFSADLNAALGKAGISHQYFVFPDGDHGLVAQRRQIYQRTMSILRPPAG